MNHIKYDLPSPKFMSEVRFRDGLELMHPNSNHNPDPDFFGEIEFMDTQVWVKFSGDRSFVFEWRGKNKLMYQINDYRC